METYIKTIKPLTGGEVYKKTPEEKLELKKVKAEYKKALKAKQNGTAKT